MGILVSTAGELAWEQQETALEKAGKRGRRFLRVVENNPDDAIFYLGGVMHFAEPDEPLAKYDSERYPLEVHAKDLELSAQYALELLPENPEKIGWHAFFVKYNGGLTSFERELIDLYFEARRKENKRRNAEGFDRLEELTIKDGGAEADFTFSEVPGGYNLNLGVLDERTGEYVSLFKDGFFTLNDFIDAHQRVQPWAAHSRLVCLGDSEILFSLECELGIRDRSEIPVRSNVCTERVTVERDGFEKLEQLMVKDGSAKADFTFSFEDGIYTVNLSILASDKEQQKMPGNDYVFKNKPLDLEQFVEMYQRVLPWAASPTLFCLNSYEIQRSVESALGHLEH